MRKGAKVICPKTKKTAIVNNLYLEEGEALIRYEGTKKEKKVPIKDCVIL